MNTRLDILRMIQNNELAAEEGVSQLSRLIDGSTEPPSAGLHYFAPEWQEKPLPDTSRKAPGDLLVFVADDVVLLSPSEMGGSTRTIRVRRGAEYARLGRDHFAIDPECESNYTQLLEALAREGELPSRILHLWSTDPFTGQEASLNEQLGHGFYSLLFLTQALLAQRSLNAVSLIYGFLSEPGVDHPLYGAAKGLSRVVRLERPGFDYRTVALESSILRESDLGLLLREFDADGERHTDVRLAGGSRLVRAFSALPLTEAENEGANLPLKHRGVYLITGGCGGLGLIFARHLAARYQARLVLSGRSGLTETITSKLSELQQLGAEVVYVQADVSDREAATRLVSEAHNRFGRIDGILHSAGLLKDGFLLKKRPAEAREVLAAKVFGTVWLDQLTAGEQLDFFAMFSSLSAVVGNLGQGDYAFANAFMDGLSAWRNAQGRPGRTLSINWPFWLEGGMQVKDEALALAGHVGGLAPLPSELGIKAFEEGLRRSVSQWVVLCGTGDGLHKLLNDAAKVPSGRTPVPTAEAVSPGAGHSVSSGSIDEHELREKAEAFLRSLIAKITKLPAEEIEADTPFELFGLDSLSLMGLTRELEGHFGELSKTVLFEYVDLASLTEFFLQSQREVLIKLTGVVPLVADPVLSGESPVLRSPTLASVDEDCFMQVQEPEPPKPAMAEARPSPIDGIAIIGVAGRYPKAGDIRQFWRNLSAGVDCISEVPPAYWDWREHYEPDRTKQGVSHSKWGGFLDDVDKFDPLVFNLSPREAEFMDPQERLFLQTVWHTLEDAGYTRERLAGSQVGVFAGVLWNHYQLIAQGEDGVTLPVNASIASVANRTSYIFNFQGPSIAVDTMCSSSLTAIHLAAESILRGECDVAIAGGVNVSIHPSKYVALSWGNFLSSDGRCRSFGEGGDGYVPGEGVGAVLLKPLAKAVADRDQIYAVIRATAVNHGGKTSGYTVPSPAAQARVIERALKQGGVDPRTISYIEAHGTGTALGDPIEINGLVKAFGVTQDRQYCAIGSVKSNIGHAESAAGIAGITKVLMQMRHRQLAPSLHAEQLNANITFENTPFYVQRELSEWKRPVVSGKEYPRRASVSSFGAGGTNAHIILEEYEGAAQPVDVSPEPRLIPLSARDGERLREYVGALIQVLEQESVQLNDLAFTLQAGRELMDERLAVVASDTVELVRKLRAWERGESSLEGDQFYQGSVRKGKAKAEMLLTGEEGQQFLRSLVRNRKLTRIAQLWVLGTSIDWRILQGAVPGRRISLPVYPFARTRYWVSDSLPARKGVAKQGRSLHPLVDSNISTVEQQCYTKRLRPDEPYLRDHFVGGRPVLPGAALLEMVRAAGALAWTRAPLTRLSEVVWLRPVTCDAAEQDLYIWMDPREDRIEFEVSMDAERGQGVCTRGVLRYGEELQEAEQFDLAALVRRCEVVSDQDTDAARSVTAQFRYGPSLQAIKTLYKGPGEALSRLEVPDVPGVELGAYELHPSLLDGAFQTIAALLANERPGELYLPYAIGEVEMLRPLTRTCFAYAVPSSEETQADSPIRSFHIWLLDEEGNVLVRLRRFSLKASGGGRETALQTVHTCRLVWEPADLAPVASDNLAGEHLLLLDRDDRLAEALKPYVKSVTAVEPTRGYQASRDLLRQVLDRLSAEGRMPTMIIYKGAQSGGVVDAATVRDGMETGLYSLFALTQLLVERAGGDPVRLLYLHAGGQPGEAAISGFMRTVRSEEPRLLFKAVEVAGALPDARTLLHETMADADAEVRFEAGRRFVRRLEEIPASGRDEDLPYRHRGVYLITGGTGGLGLIFAAHLARRAQARLVLAGRSPAAVVQSKLEHLQQLGAEVLYVQADVSNQEDVQRLVAEARARFGQINGVIHSAGVLHDGVLLKKRIDEMERVLAPKVFGTLYLDEAVRGEPLDFFALFSSVAAVLGNPGQADYAVANRFMDRFAELRDARVRQGDGAGRTVSFGWPLWTEGGMRVDEATVEQMGRQLGMAPLATEDGLKAFEAGLAGDDPHRVVLCGNSAVLRARLLSRPKGVNPVRAFTETAGPELVALVAEPNHTATVQHDDEAVRGWIEQHLKTVIAKQLGLQPSDLDVDEGLDQYGIDSIMINAASLDLENAFGPLSKTLFFQYQTIADLAGYFLANHREKLREKVGGNRATPVTRPTSTTSSITARPTAVANGAKRQADAPEPRATAAPGPEPQPASVAAPDRGPMDIAVIGLGGRYPQARNLQEFWANLYAGRDCVTEVPEDRWRSAEAAGFGGMATWGGFLADIDKFDPLFFHISPVDAQIMDPQERLFLETAWQTIEDAGYTRARLARAKVGVYVGVMYGHYQMFGAEQTVLGNPMALGSTFASIANRVSYFLNLTGPSIALDTMCSSSLTAIHLACESIRRGESDMALAGGVNLSVHPAKYQMLGMGKFLATDGRCRSFGDGGDGYVPGEGAGAVLLKPLDKAIADGDYIYGVIKATVINHGGKTNGYTVPNLNAQGALISEALEKARIDPRTISYVEAHGTGTALGDPIEIAGLTMAYGSGEKQYCAIGSVKSNIGHLEAAAGIASLTKVLLQMQHNQLVPTLHAERLNPNIEFSETPFFVQRELTEWRQPVVEEGGVTRTVPRRAAISAFGAGGSNAHLIVQQFEQARTSTEEEVAEPHIVVLSARSTERLKEYASGLIGLLDRAASSTQRGASPRQEMQLLLLEKIAALLNISPQNLSVSDELLEYGFDWVHCNELARGVGEALGLDLSATDVTGSRTIESLAATWARLMPGAESALDAEHQEPLSLPDLSFTLQMGREAMAERLAILVTSLEELRSKLALFCHGEREIAGAFTGNVRDGKELADLFAGGETGQQYVQWLMQQRDYARLARLWVRGADVDWHSLPRVNPAVRVPLPTYPFERQRCWFPEQKSTGVRTPLQAAAVKYLHPLLHTNESTLQACKYETSLAETPSALRQQKLLGQSVLAAGAVVEMMRAAGALGQEAPVGRISNLRLRRPIPGGATDQKLVTRLYTEADTVRVEVGLRSGTLAEELVARVDLHADLPTDETVVDLSQIRSRLSQEISGTTAYSRLQNRAMAVEPGLQVIERMFMSRHETLALMKAPPDVGTGCLLDPTLLEGALQAALLLYFTRTSEGNGKLLVLGGIGSIAIAAGVSGSCWAHVELLEEAVPTFNIQLVDTMGRVLLTMAKVAFVPVQGAGGDTHNQTPRLLTKAWKREAIAPVNQAITGKVLILVNQESRALAEQFQAAFPGADPVIITAEKDDPDRSRQTIHMLQNKFNTVSGVVDLSDLYREPVSHCTGSVGKVALLQELLRQTGGQPLFLLHVTAGLQPLHAGVRTLAGADFVGLMRMLAGEYGRVHARTVDLDVAWPTAHALWRIIADECAVRGGATEVCYRRGERYVPYMEPIAGEPSGEPFALDASKVIVVTGGTRGIGAEVARHLVRRGARKLVLMGVQSVPSRDQWDSWLADPAVSRRVADRINLVRELEKAGAHVTIYAGSLTDPTPLSDFFEHVRRSVGAIGGVVHCAGYSDDETPAFVLKSVMEIAKVFEPKIAGLQVLHDVFRRDDLDFFLLFSSISAAIPALSVGLSAYAQANAFMDGFAAYQAGTGRPYYHSVQWPVWDGVGMARGVSPVYRRLGFEALTLEQGLALFDWVLQVRPASPVLPCFTDDRQFRIDQLMRIDTSEEPRATAVRPTPVTSKALPGQRSAGEQAASQQKLTELFATTLQIPAAQLDQDTPFGDYGVESVMLANLVQKVEAMVGTKIDPSVFLENPTLGSLSAYLAEQLSTEPDMAEVAVSLQPESEPPGPTASTNVERGGLDFQWAPAAQGTGSGRVAIIGVGCHFPGVRDKDAYWQNLASGECSITEVPRSRWNPDEYWSPAGGPGKTTSKWGGFIEAIEYFDPAYFNFREEEAAQTDPLIRQFLEVSVETLHDAGYAKKDIWGKRVGVFVGGRAGLFAPQITQVSKGTVLGIGQNFISSHVSHFLNLKGPSVVVDTACSSSLVSVHMALQSLQSGESDMVIAGGVEILLNEKPYLLLSEGQALSPDGLCHTFDEKANGFVPGEGCGAVLLKRLEDALADGDRIYAVIESSAVNNDGHTMGVTTPNPEAQMAVIREALAKGQIDPSTVTYVEAHGTGTMIGDPIELKALTRVFREFTQDVQFCAIGSVKTNFGHLLSAAGIASLIKVVLSLQHKQIPPTLHCDTPNPRFRFEASPFFPNTALTPWAERGGVRRAGLSSFGFGGTNAHMIVAEGEAFVPKGYLPRRSALPPVEFQRKWYWPETVADLAGAGKRRLLEIIEE